MQWEGREESQNVEDRRGVSGGTMAIGGVGGVVLLILALVFGVDPALLQVNQPPRQQPNKQWHEGAEEKQLASFTKVVFHDTEVVWDELFRKMGRQYEKPILVLFSGQVDSRCGMAESAVGPFYCPGDSRVYIDLSFYAEMEQKLDAPGEFARAYVIAHEVGHHVQRLLGYSQRAEEEMRRGAFSKNEMSVRLELQADFLAGVWAYHGQRRFNFLESGDIESALHAAFEIGDDRLQQKGRGYVVPDSFTHGTSRQRSRWFMQGFKNGNVNEARALFELAYKQL